jgi:hypothetical protein
MIGAEIRRCGSGGVGGRVTAAALVFLFLLGTMAEAQTLRFSNHRRIGIPAYATLRIGPFYSTMVFSQSAGYRYTRSSGTGTDFLFDNERGTIEEDGSEIPMVSALNFRNYLLVSPTMDMDMSVSMSYSHYPLGTQEDAFEVNLAEEGIIGDLSTEFELTPFVKGTVYDGAVYKTDYIDTRGIIDPYGGSRYENFRNIAGINLDWLMAEDKNVALSASREDNIPRSDQFKDQKRVSYTESVGYEQRLNEFVAAGVGASYGQNTYPSATNRPDSFSQSYSAHTAARLTERTAGAAAVGYSFGSVSGNGAEDNDGSGDGTMTASLSLQTQMSKRLAHALTFSRAQQAGFNSPFEIYSSYGYNLTWKGDLTSAGVFSRLNTVDPQSMTVSKYSDWNSGINVSHPMYVDLPLICGNYITLLLSSGYDVRSNESVGTEEPTEVEWTGDYSTWVSRIGTSFPFVWDQISCSTYVEHIQRMSDVSDLAYKRDIFEITFTYSHEF